jgi:AraC-like DNA-binding protein
MADPCVSAAALRDWQASLARLDGAAGSACACRLARIEALLADEPEFVALSDCVGLLEEIGRACRPSALAWSAGLAVQLPFGSELGRATLGCKSLGSALHWICQYFPLLQDASSLRLDVDEDWTTLSYKILDPAIWPRHEDAMYTLGIYARLIKTAAPEAWGQVQITVEAEAEQVNADLASIVQAGVVYGGSANMIRFPTAIINMPLNLAPPADPAILKKLTSELSARKRATPITDRTRQMIYREMNDGCVSQEHIARELGISSRTLRRRLADENRSFQMLLDECRMQFAALEFRTRKKLSLSDMALKLGYSEHSTFSRAFARWAGMAPQEYRRALAA